MNPEREKQVDRLFESALALAPAERAAYLEEACAGDRELREQVEALVAYHERGTGEETVLPREAEGLGAQAAAAQAEAEDLAPGRAFGSYMILGKLGEGGMGTVYLAKDVRLGRRVALKFLPARYAGDAVFVRRFMQEARAASQLNHPNILVVHEIGQHEGRHFIATEFIEGETVRRLLAHGPLRVEEAIDVCVQVAAALTKAHQNGVVHRDIKPENVMVGEERHVKVLDFGIAKQLHASKIVDTEAPTTARFDTAPGVVLGTSAYMSPEQVRGFELDARTDVWSLGCVLYEMLTGRTPFDAPTHGDLIVAVLNEEPPPLARWRADVPEDLERVVSKALAKRKESRYQSARDLQADLVRLRQSLQLLPGAARDADTASHLGPFDRGPRPTQGPSGFAHTFTTGGQRRQVTILFADLAGLASLTEGLDAEEVGELLADLWPRVDARISEHGGAIDKHVGDAVVALWGAAGAAREDDPERAIRAALAIDETVGEFAAANLHDTAPTRSKRGGEDEGAKGQSLVRAGVSTGLVLVAPAGGTGGGVTATGEAVSLASRLAQSAPVGAILVTHDTYRHVRGVFDVRAPVTFKLEGKSAPVEIYRVLRTKPRAFRQRTRGVEGVETRMVGRRGELRLLTDTLQAVFEERELHVITVVAEAGLGKSRLLYEFANRVELLPEEWYIFNGRGSEATQGLPYALLRDVFSFRFEIQDSDPPAIAREKLERGMTEMVGGGGEEASMRAHFVGQLIGLDFSDSRHLSGILDDARQIRDRAFRYAAQFFAEVSRSSPIVLYFDDIHWADDGSLDFISYLARNCAAVPMLVLCLARTSLLERRPAWGEGEESHALVRLQPLSKKESRQLVEEILRHARNVPERLRDLVVSGAEGNPFYVEELIKMLIEQRVIVPGADEWSVDANRLGEVKVPPTLTGVLQARLDNLTPREYAALQRASVVGRVFWDSAVEHLGADSAETRVGEPPHAEISAAVAEVLESLRRKELIYRREGSSFAGANEYLFKHTLLRDVTYESVLRRERRAYHRRVAEWLVLKSGGRVAEHAAHVAEHYEQAREERHAARWYARAGQQARETYAPEAAILYYRKALEFPPPLSASTDEEPGTGARRAATVALYDGLGEVLRVQARYAESMEAYERMREAAAALGDRATEARAWNEVALVRASQGDNRSTLDAARRAEALAREAGDGEQARVEMAHALSLQSQASTRLGDARAAMRLATQALTYATQLGEAGRRVAADSLKSLGMAHHILGNFERAEHYKEQALHTYRERGDRRGVGNLLNSLGETARLRGDYEAAFRRYQEALSIAREIGNRNGEILYLSNLGAARTGLGDYAAAESDLRQTIELASAAGYFGLSENYRFLAEALLGQGQAGAALEAAHKALELGREFENQEHIGEAWRVLGLVASHSSLALTVGDQTFDAAACFAESLRVFAAIKMESERARTLREWARHEMARGDRERGQNMLREAHDIFTKLGMQLEVERTGAVV